MAPDSTGVAVRLPWLRPREPLTRERLWTLVRDGMEMQAELAHHGFWGVRITITLNGDVQCEQWFDDAEAAIGAAVVLCQAREREGWR
ncbi:MAG: hypothetical protein QM736_03825 [Vicinamibacterales bacterium]